MRLFALAATAALSLTALAKVDIGEFTQAEVDDGTVLSKLSAAAMEQAMKLIESSNGACTKENLKIRREWRNMPAEERKDYVRAVKCLMEAKPRVDPAVCPGCVSRFEDFIYVHMDQTPFAHDCAQFLLWHRYFNTLWETALIEECGYTGTQPYWEWGFDTEDMVNSPLFDGSETSIGSDGEYIPNHGGLTLGGAPGSPPISAGEGSGGGCVMKGPFSDMVVHLGPASLPVPGSFLPQVTADPTKDNPRCLKRDLNPRVGALFASFRNSTDLIMDYDTIEYFQGVMQGEFRYIQGSIGVHGGGHYMVAGDPGGDVLLSPGDPYFHLHHGQIDRLYWIWQMQDWENRQDIFGTGTMYNSPPSDTVTLDEVVDLDVLGGPISLRDMMSTVGGTPFCFVYE